MKNAERKLREMARFYERTLFYGLPEIKVSYSGKGMGAFCMDSADDYCPCEDELTDEYLYRKRYVETAPGVGYYKNHDFSWQDVENHPKVQIKINKSLQGDLRKLTAVLLHELCHYYLWYIGYDYHDNDGHFLSLCRKMGLPTNYDHRWDGRKWVETYDYSLVDKYIEMYKGRECA